MDGVTLYKYRPYSPGGGGVGFLVEYVYSFVATAWLTAKAWRRRHFGALQACNPPDIFWPLGIAFRIIGGSRFVFDHHDLCPELYESRFPDSVPPALLGASCARVVHFPVRQPRHLHQRVVPPNRPTAWQKACRPGDRGPHGTRRRQAQAWDAQNRSCAGEDDSSSPISA